MSTLVEKAPPEIVSEGIVKKRQWMRKRPAVTMNRDGIRDGCT
jgi:hypothetical protein